MPKDKILYRFDQISITINYAIGNIEYQAQITEKRHKIAQDFIKGMVHNPNDISNSYKTANVIVNVQNPTTVSDKLIIPWKPSAIPNVSIPDYIVITNEVLRPSFEPFVQYKIQRGIPTILVTVEDIYANYAGCDNAEKVRNYLKTAHQYWGAGLFVLLGGDTDIVPARLGSRITIESFPIEVFQYNYTDFYYCDVYKSGDNKYNWNSSGDEHFGNNTYSNFGNGTDVIEFGTDNFIGRAPVDTVQEANNFIAKIISYENLSGVTDKNYVNNMLFLGAYSGYVQTYPYNNPDGQLWHYNLANKPFLNNPLLKKHLLFDDYQGTTYSNSNPLYYYIGNEELNKLSALNNLNLGKPSIGKFHLVSHFDHGSPFGIGTSSKMKGEAIYREDIDNMSNGSYYQIMYSTSCDPAEFKFDCFAEHYVNAVNGGGVAIIANSGTVWTNGNLQDDKLFHSIYGSLSPSSYLMGTSFSNARDALPGNYRQKQLTLLGEPTMAIWSATPQNITLMVQPSITINNAIANVLPVTINALTEVAKVTLYKYNPILQIVEVYASQDLAVGSTTVQFVVNPDTLGELKVMVTAKNYLPANASVNVLIPQAHLYVSGYSFIDANNNGVIEQGEQVTLSINLTNSGATNITAINTVLSSSPLFATVTNGTVTFPQINAGQTVTLTGYTFTAGSSNSLSDFILLMLNITASGGYLHNDNFYLELKNPVLTLGARSMFVNSIQTTAFSLGQDHNLKISLTNIGNVPTGLLTATLTTTMSDVNISVAPSNYSSISNTSTLNTPDFVFNFTGATIPVGAKPFRLTLTNPFNKTWSFDFNLNEPLPPLITNFRYTSTATDIKLMWNPITNIAGYNIYRSNDIAGPYQRINNFLVTGSAFYNDMGLAITTEYFYKISVVTLTGNELPLINVVTNNNLQGYKATTSLDLLNSFPVQAEGTNFNSSSPTLYNVDNDITNKKEIILNFSNGQNIGKIMGFRESGQELFDIDNNPTSISGFANTNIGMVTNSAVGDVDNDDLAEVFSIGRNDATNQGKLYAFKTIDSDNDNKPDKLWNDEAIAFGWRVGTNPVLYDVDGNGFLDIIVVTENQQIYVYDKDKNVMPGWPIQIGTNNFSSDYSEGQVAVADLDHDGKGEIAIGFKTGTVDNKGAIYIWHHDGTPFTTNPFKEFANNERADSGIVFADIDNDLNLDILITTKQCSTCTTGKIYAFKQNGSPVNSTWNGVNTFNTTTGQYSEGIIPRIAVGNLDKDSNSDLEIVFGSKGLLYVLNKFGNNVNGFPKPIIDISKYSPILTDIDTDPEVEIVLNNAGQLLAFNADGSIANGFPVVSNTAASFTGCPSIDDLDNDGKNEIVIAANGASVVYKTNGHSINNEWSSYRANPHNTGTYKEVCNNVKDLMIRDGLTDLGKEPNTVTPYMWTSPDIWIRQFDDSIYEPQNAEYSPTNPNYAYVRVTNKSCVTSLGTEQVTLYWAKAGISFDWPTTWDGTGFFPVPNNNVRMGEPVGTMLIPILAPGQSTIVKFPFFVPDPAIYAGINAQEPSHFCMLARIEGTDDMPIETNDLYQNVQNNNNLGWVNFSIIDFEIEPDPQNSNLVNSALVGVGNPYDTTKAFYLEIVKEDLETGKNIYDEAEVSIKMDQTLYNAWVRGGKISEKLLATSNEKNRRVTDNHVLLDNLLFNPKEMGTLTLKFNFLTKELTDKTKFVYHVIQKDKLTNKIIGGETYIIRKKPRQPFNADAGGDKIVDRNQPVTIQAVQINEPAIYNWYDATGNLIFTGKDLQIANAVAQKYKLEVISAIDGFKDYSEMEVRLNPNRLKTIVPNPVNENTKISYNLENVSSAYLMVVSYYMNGGVSNNYLLDINTSDININFSGYANGFYKVALIANGNIVDTKIIFKQ